MTPVPAQLTKNLLAHYDRSGRDLPWRRTEDPYAIWVSEVMLQQTRVETVIPYYRSWMERFPTLAAVAAAPLDEVLRLWAGLGYYARARSFHRAARVVCERRQGDIPADRESLLALPGVGAYTAGAIASIAFGEPVPAVDGNVRRVLSRLYDLDTPTERQLNALATELVDPARPGDLNQAIMDLGATICRPRAPVCEQCPVSSSCAALANGTIPLRPERRSTRPRPTRSFTVGVALCGARVLVRRRPEDGLLGGMWEFPNTEIQDESGPMELARAALSPGFEHQPSSWKAAQSTSLGEVHHEFTHFRARYQAFLFDVGGSMKRKADGNVRWVPFNDLNGLAMPVAQRKIGELAREFAPRS